MVKTQDAAALLDLCGTAMTLAEQLVEALLQVVANERPASQILPTELIVRDSSLRRDSSLKV